MRFARILVASILWVAAGCQSHGCGGERASEGSKAAVVEPHLPAGEAGRVLQKAIAAAGGWKVWQAKRDVTFVSTLTIFDSRGDATSETIFLHKQLLHRGPIARMESIGLREEIVFGYDGAESWMLRGGRLVEQPQEKMFTEFHGISATLSFGLPFVLAELQGLTLEYLGEEADEERRWEKLRVTYGQHWRSPIRWAILYFDAESGLIDHVYAQVEAPFLEHPIWLGRWREYRDVGGIRQERVRSFYPADSSGSPVGGLAAEQLIEHLQFNVGLPPALFLRPPQGSKGSVAAAQELDWRTAKQAKLVAVKRNASGS